ncbi:GABA permease [Xylona heveae TC161]|uniref:GABA permease n=1 Tax=Xylona heveae (strain CBS 132557 / TC161) TaxID=1328760 RepID=A0A165G3R7_XYLHT|nr:GABA permease [Xylona heveae TC161]KZF21705.1 GABA permease [Xylona heveae TC161]
MTENAENTQVFDRTTLEDDAVAQLGYQQELKRSFGLLGMVGFSFSIVTSWTALGGTLIIGAESGGPPVMIWSWIGICLFTLAVAYSMAEMCSAYPLAGGQYSWVAVLAPPKVARGLSWITGWFMVTGVLAMGATNNFVAANFILGQANLANPGYTIERWHTVLVAYCIVAICIVTNIWGRQILDKLSTGILFWNITSFVIVIVVVLACNDNKQSPSFVFKDMQNFTGFGTAFAALIGILQSAFGMCCYDAPSHMIEEMRDGRKQAPRAIILSVVIGCFTGFVFLIAICFCIKDLASTGETSTGVPLIQIFYDSTGSKVGTCFLTSMISVIALVASNSLLAEGSRALYAFARDNGLPFSSFFSRVDSKKKVPIFALLLAALVQVALDAIYFGTVTGFETVISISTEGFYLSYAMPILVRILNHLTGTHQNIGGSWQLGRWGLPLNIVAFLFLIFCSITFNFPTENPVTKDNMNYTSAAIGVIGVISLITWITTGRKHFSGPLTHTRAEEVVGMHGTPPVESDAAAEKQGLAN